MRASGQWTFFCGSIGFKDSAPASEQTVEFSDKKNIKLFNISMLFVVYVTSCVF